MFVLLRSWSGKRNLERAAPVKVAIFSFKRDDCSHLLFSLYVVINFYMSDVSYHSNKYSVLSNNN